MENNPTPQPTPAPEQPLFAGTPAPAPTAGNTPKKSHTGLIIGLVVGIIAIAAFLVVLFAVILPNANNDNKEEKKDNNTSKEEKKDPDPTPTPAPTTDPDPDPTPTPTPSKNQKVLVCNRSESGDGYRQSVEVHYTYTNSILSSITVTEETYKASGFSDQDIKDAQKETNSYYDSNKFTKWDVRRKDNYTVILETELKLEGNDVSAYETYEKAKAYALNSGFTCK